MFYNPTGKKEEKAMEKTPRVGREKEAKKHKKKALLFSPRLLLRRRPTSGSSSLRDREPHRALLSPATTAGRAPPADLAVRHQEDVEVVTDGGGDLSSEVLVGLLARRGLGRPSDGSGDPVDVRVHGEVFPLQGEEHDASWSVFFFASIEVKKRRKSEGGEERDIE